MKKRKLIKQATLVLTQGSCVADVLVENGFVSEIDSHIEESSDCQVVTAKGKLLTYGLCDLHVHFREPGQEHKETIRTGSLAAAAGGYTAVCTMPNLSPAPDSIEILDTQRQRIHRDSVVDIFPYATLTMGRSGSVPVSMAALKRAAIAFSDDGSGVQSAEVMRQLMRQAATEDCIIAAHCEDNTLLHGGYIHDGLYAQKYNHTGICSESEWKQLERDLQLALETGCRYHACHLSTKESISLMRQYKKLGARVTCETAPHYLLLCDEDLQEDGRFKMNPPLRTAYDRVAILEGIWDGTIDVIATDHAPHTPEEKSKGLKNSPFGIVGLETAFPVLYTHLVGTNILTTEKLIECMCQKPREIFRIPGHFAVGQPADLALFDVENDFQINSQNFLSKGKSTPFDGWTVKGKCLLTMKNGEIVYQDKNWRI